MTHRSTHASVRRAFSLIEVMIVLAIILVIAGLVSVTVFGRRDQADADVTRVNLNTLGDALAAFRFDFRRYPTDDEGLAVLWDKSKLDPEADASLWSSYLEAPLDKDAWGKQWGYAQQSESYEPDEENPVSVPPFDLWSYGPDGEDGTEDDIRVGATAAADNAEEPGGDLIPADEP